MNKKSLLSIFVLLCVIALTACTGNDAKKLLLGDTDKYNNTPKQAVEELFNVTVMKVNVINVKSKPKRVRYQLGKTRTWKKAIVTVAEGDTIEIFASV